MAADRFGCCCGLIPPYVFDQLARNTTGVAQEAAIEALQIDANIRALRQAAPIRRGAMRGTALQTETGGRQRQVFDCQNRESANGPLLRSEGGIAVSDATANEAFDGMGATHDFFAEVFKRESIDDEGLALNGYVHYGRRYNNAFWDGQRMVFGDGDGVIFKSFTNSVEVIGHELTHGVTEDEAGLVYLRQPGALNESMSDVFGSMVKQYVRGQTAAEADWLIGEDIFAPGINATALRSLKAPGQAYDDPKLGRDPQPDHLKKLVETTHDNGGVHINSGIPNLAFYLVATALGGRSWERAGLIWYEALRDPKLRSTSGFRAFARVTAAVATARFGLRSDEVAAVAQGWAEVGVKL